MKNKFNFKSIIGFTVLVSLLFVISCSTQNEHKSSVTKKQIKKTEKDFNTQTETKKKDSKPEADLKADAESDAPNKESTKVTKKECENVNVGDDMILKSQTFPIDFKPFEGSCFVTKHNPEYDDPPIGSEIAIYKNGEKVYKFDTRYHADAATCWIEAVAFQDLNNDELKDIVVVGKCGAKAGQIQGNEVFANNGKGFDTDVKGNDALEDFKTVKEISNFVKKNQKLFFK